MKPDEKPPRGTPADVRRAFAAKVGRLEALSLLEGADVDQVTSWARWYAIRDRAFAEIERDGVTVVGRGGVRVRHPASTVARQASGAMAEIDRTFVATRAVIDPDARAIDSYLDGGRDDR